MFKKGDIDLDVLGKWAIAIAVLVIILGGYFILKGRLGGYLDYIKNLFMFGG